MTRLDELLLSVLDGLPGAVSDPSTGLTVLPTAVDVDLPIEAYFGGGGDFLATVPRGRFDSGFRMPLGRVQAHYRLTDGEEEE